MINHQLGQEIAVNEHYLIVYAGNKIMGIPCK